MIISSKNQLLLRNISIKVVKKNIEMTTQRRAHKKQYILNIVKFNKIDYNIRDCFCLFILILNII
ncbi:hypothetical protein P618_200098 [Holospora obtusa F1]|uniref:Uncharacterized protein n=2 Tax=Holospora obtusa TaxID=49893 RepID=W6TI73_HOLOB|nr:hypothetical protein P618_200098 [Holospora obtusa F1]